LDRNYNLLTEVLISIREALQDGIPHLKDFQAVRQYGVIVFPMGPHTL